MNTYGDIIVLLVRETQIACMQKIYKARCQKLIESVETTRFYRL